MVSSLKKGCNLWHRPKSGGPKSLLPAPPLPYPPLSSHPPLYTCHTGYDKSSYLDEHTKLQCILYAHGYHVNMNMGPYVNAIDVNTFFRSFGLCLTAFTGLTARLWMHSSTVALAFSYMKDIEALPLSKFVKEKWFISNLLCCLIDGHVITC